jgi:hypothetical protein
VREEEKKEKGKKKARVDPPRSSEENWEGFEDSTPALVPASVHRRASSRSSTSQLLASPTPGASEARAAGNLGGRLWG